MGATGDALPSNLVQADQLDSNLFFLNFLDPCTRVEKGPKKGIQIQDFERAVAIAYHLIFGTACKRSDQTISYHMLGGLIIYGVPSSPPQIRMARTQPLMRRLGMQATHRRIAQQ